MDKHKTAELIRQIPGSGAVIIDEPMSRHTSFRVGGPADVFVRPETIRSAVDVIKACRENGIPAIVIGNGTNLIIRDGGIRAAVIQLADNVSGYEVYGEVISAEAGILISKLSRIALERGLTGLEFAEGIPGTLGGAVTMNAGAYDGEMSMVVSRTEYLRPDGSICILDNEQHQFGKRSSIIQADGGVVLKTAVRLRKGDKKEIKEKMDDFNARRREKQPLDMPSAGSIFKRPEGYYAGKLVQDCGLRGYRIGGAEVSALHCGFIVNTGNASAGDVISLIEHIRDAVYRKFEVMLETEVKIIGED
ncbi:MAG: UDP-N-acetylmuramate dehydrogenase [Clostridiaceae bacterium]|nr:UDP-N-acetylmuramate dehydrogenase [Clostridiaceae bacterium]